jgi:hypothetical protein
MSDPMAWTNGLPERDVRVVAYEINGYAVLKLKWAERGTGFGEFTVSGNMDTGEWHVDTEAMGPEWCLGIFKALEAATKPRSPEAGR